MGIRLLHTVGKPYVDDLLADIVHQYESSFPNRVRSYFLLGSYADGCAVVGSDIDVYVLFKETFLSPKEVIQAQQLATACVKKSVLRLDGNVIDEHMLQNYVSTMRVAIKQNSILLFGEDTRAA